MLTSRTVGPRGAAYSQPPQWSDTYVFPNQPFFTSGSGEIKQKYQRLLAIGLYACLVRERALPAHVVVYYVIALSLYMQVSCRELLRCLLEGVEWLWKSSARHDSISSSIW